MTILITGGCKNGKSSFAQDLAVKMNGCFASLAMMDSAMIETPCTARTKQSNLIYFATMIPHDSEDNERIKKHREDRKNLGFKTIECGKNISEAIKKIKPNSVVLFDSLTALVANELFENPDDSVILSETLSENSSKITQKIQSELSELIEKCESVIFVSDSIFRDGKIYDETTELYRRILAQTENFIAKKADKVVEMVTGKRKMENEKRKTENERNFQFSIFNFHLIIGGSYQGKMAWAKSTFSLSDDDIFVCTENELPDFSKKCISHYEKYVAFCLKNNLSPKTDFSDCVSGADERKIIICDDIFCGVVPIDSFQRKWREETGLALQKIAKNAQVTRIFCGIAERLQ